MIEIQFGFFVSALAVAFGLGMALHHFILSRNVKKEISESKKLADALIKRYGS